LIRCCGGAAESVRDCGHDRQAEPGTGSGSVGTAEPFEGAVEEPWRKALALVAYVQHDCRWNLDCLEPHGADLRQRSLADRLW
jgi:hypothetical protein